MVLDAAGEFVADVLRRILRWRDAFATELDATNPDDMGAIAELGSRYAQTGFDLRASVQLALHDFSGDIELGMWWHHLNNENTAAWSAELMVEESRRNPDRARTIRTRLLTDELVRPLPTLLRE